MDNIPMDVIRYELFPFLDFESRINLNQCLPPQDRVSKKFDKAFIEAHQRDIYISMIRVYLYQIDEISAYDKKFKTISKMLKLLQTPAYIAFTNKHLHFRQAVLNKAAELRNHTTYLGIGGSLEGKVALIKQAKKLQALLL